MKQNYLDYSMVLWRAGIQLQIAFDKLLIAELSPDQHTIRYRLAQFT